MQTTHRCGYERSYATVSMSAPWPTPSPPLAGRRASAASLAAAHGWSLTSVKHLHIAGVRPLGELRRQRRPRRIPSHSCPAFTAHTAGEDIAPKDSPGTTKLGPAASRSRGADSSG
jgi:hypothetical protein